ncbi:hypothetical protein JX265_006491 [Neoarthrinium moseri]|uniref:RING-type domain-containing protein n=1 Tax=Neoarthrinium moseri TaxID=1658444 RepID=A0A9P9WL76_9PEZI|nr:hypothetical protein JX265_006491 [Neoarthrinium moseri]
MSSAHLGKMSEDNMTLIMQLLAEDSEHAVSAAVGKGKLPEGKDTDYQIACKLYLEEVQSLQAFTDDQRMARSIQQAIRRDGDAIAQSQNEERVAEADHNFSVALSNGQNAPPRQATEPPIDDEETEFLQKLLCIYITGVGDADDNDGNLSYELDGDGDTDMSNQPESSAWAASRQVTKPQPKRHCEACGDWKHFALVAKAPCGHEYCRECLQRLFVDAMTDESLFPPRCCRQPIPLDKNRLFLNGNIVQEFQEKALEFSTPNRTYCHDRDCGAFIPAANYVKVLCTTEIVPRMNNFSRSYSLLERRAGNVVKTAGGWWSLLSDATTWSVDAAFSSATPAVLAGRLALVSNGKNTGSSSGPPRLKRATMGKTALNRTSAAQSLTTRSNAKDEFRPWCRT